MGKILRSLVDRGQYQSLQCMHTARGIEEAELIDGIEKVSCGYWQPGLKRVVR